MHTAFIWFEEFGIFRADLAVKYAVSGKIVGNLGLFYIIVRGVTAKRFFLFAYTISVSVVAAELVEVGDATLRTNCQLMKLSSSSLDVRNR